MYLIFIPAEIKKSIEIERYFEKALLKPKPIAYVIYFQSIKWILPDLEETVKSLDYKLVKYGKLNKLCRISYGKFTFDKSFKSDPENISRDNMLTEVVISLNNLKLTVLVSELPLEMGTPKLFESVKLE